MLQPKRRKYRREFRGVINGKSYRGSKLSFGEFGLKCLGSGWLSSAQIEAARRAITHHTKRSGKLWIRIFPDKPVTDKAAGMPMGKGKGPVDHYVAVVRPGRVLFELDGVSETMAREALGQAARKLSLPTNFIKHSD